MADRITVMRNGRTVGEYLPAELSRLRLVSLMVGREFEPAARRSPCRAPPRHPSALLQAQGLGRRGQPAAAGPAAAQRRGAGPGGAAGIGPHRGRAAAVRRRPPDSGDAAARRPGLPLRCTRREAVQHGLAFCPEERKTEGIVAELGAREHRAGAAGQARLAAIPRPRAGELADATSANWASRPPTPRCPSASSRAATSRRPCWRAGWPPNRAC
jgi:monosaccharide-transporting ATPase